MYKKVILSTISALFLISASIFLSACNATVKSGYIYKATAPEKQSMTNLVLSETASPAGNTIHDEPTNNEPTSEIPVISTANENIEKRSTYSTKFNVKDKGRTNNITVAANSIDGTVLQPNEVFSYNNAVGPTIKRRGYKVARIFKNGKDGKGYGGGVCQVSSTLYNAAELFGMEIIERHPHSKEVKYVPKDRDAATSYGGVDLKFKNTQAYPVKIEASVADGVITIDMVGLT